MDKLYGQRWCSLQFVPSKPFGIANSNTMFYNVGHEIGHIFGASHDDKTHKKYGTSPSFKYGRGYLMKDNFRTIMA